MTDMLSERLRKITDCIPQCNVLADVGCDHGYIGTTALLEGKAERVVFIDISRPSLDKAVQFCAQMNVSDRFTFVCRDGLGDCVADVAVIAGMGGMETISVLKGAQQLPEVLVLQPMKNVDELRRYLQSCYFIVSDRMFKDGKFYNLIVARRGQDTLSEDEILFGKTNISNPQQDFLDYLEMEANKYQQIANSTTNSDVANKLRHLRETLNTVKENTQCYKQKC